MKVLVTGATGFIGNKLIPRLLDRNIEVIATSIVPDLKASEFVWYNRVRYIQYNISRSTINPGCFKMFGEPDRMIHLAWAGLPNYDSFIHIEDNLFNSYSFIRSMVDGGLRNLTSIGTCLEYGMQNGCLSEDAYTLPTTSYGLAKDTLRKLIEDLRKKIDFSFKWIRLFYMYGSGQGRGSILAQLKQALDSGQETFNMSAGEQLRDYLDVDVVSENIAKIALQDSIDGIINCCSGKPTKIKDLVLDYIEKSGKSIKLNLGYYPYTKYEPMEFWGDNTKLMRIK